MNSVKYIETLDNNLWPVVAKTFGNSAWIFQEDNPPCHVSRQCNAWKADNDICVFDNFKVTSYNVASRIIYKWGTCTGAIRRLRFEIVNIEITQHNVYNYNFR
jgi:hypothetical protein